MDIMSGSEEKTPAESLEQDANHEEEVRTATSQVVPDTQSEVGKLYHSHIFVGEGNFDPLTTPQPSPFGPPPFASWASILTGLSEHVNDIQASIYLDNEATPHVIRSSIRSIANYLRMLRNIPDPVQQINDNDQKKDKCAVLPLHEGKEAEEPTRRSKTTDTEEGEGRWRKETEEVYPLRALTFLLAFISVSFIILIIIGVISLTWIKD